MLNKKIPKETIYRVATEIHNNDTIEEVKNESIAVEEVEYDKGNGSNYDKSVEVSDDITATSGTRDSIRIRRNKIRSEIVSIIQQMDDNLNKLTCSIFHLLSEYWSLDQHDQ